MTTRGTWLVAALAFAACRSSTNPTVEPKPSVSPPVPDARAPMAPSQPEVDDGFGEQRTNFWLDGEDLVEASRDRVTWRDGAFASRHELAIADVVDVALLPDHSIVVLSGGRERTLHHVVEHVERAAFPRVALGVFAARSADAIWASSGRNLAKLAVDTGKQDTTAWLPENADASRAARLDDGTLAMVDGWTIVVVVDGTIARFAWDDGPRFLVSGPRAGQVWASTSGSPTRPATIVLLALANERATPIATHALATGEHVVHLAARGAIVAAITAHTTGPYHAEHALRVFDADGERWHVALGASPPDEPTPRRRAFTAAISPTRVIVRELPDRYRAWDPTTGKPR